MSTFLRPLILPEQVAPSNPPSGFGAYYVGTDHRPYMRNDGGESLRLDNTFCLPFSVPGVLTAGSGAIPLPVPFSAIIEAVSSRLGTSGTAVADVNLNGTTIFTSTKVSFSASQTPTVGGFATTEVSASDYFQVDIDSASGGAANLGLVIWLRRTG